MASGTIDGKYYENIPTPEDWGRAQEELADLQRQLREAQEELKKADRTAIYWQEEGQKAADGRDEARALGEGLYLLGNVWVNQRDAAIEERDEVNETLILIRSRELEAISRWRGEDVQRYLTQPDYGELLDWLNAERTQAIVRAEAAERDAEAQRALAERLVGALRDFFGMHPFGKTGICISCGGRAEDYPGQIHYPNCLWVRHGNGILYEITKAELRARSATPAEAQARKGEGDG